MTRRQLFAGLAGSAAMAARFGLPCFYVTRYRVVLANGQTERWIASWWQWGRSIAGHVARRIP